MTLGRGVYQTSTRDESREMKTSLLTTASVPRQENTERGVAWHSRVSTAVAPGNQYTMKHTILTNHSEIFPTRMFLCLLTASAKRFSRPKLIFSYQCHYCGRNITNGNSRVAIVIDVGGNVGDNVRICVGQIPFQETGLWTESPTVR